MICKKSSITKITVSKLHIDTHTNDVFERRRVDSLHWSQNWKTSFPLNSGKLPLLTLCGLSGTGSVFRLLRLWCLVLAAPTLYGLWWRKYSLYHRLLRFTPSSAAILRKIITMTMSLEIAWDQDVWYQVMWQHAANEVITTESALFSSIFQRGELERRGFHNFPLNQNSLTQFFRINYGWKKFKEKNCSSTLKRR